MATIHVSDAKQEPAFDDIAEGAVETWAGADVAGDLEERLVAAQQKLANSKVFKTVQTLQSEYEDAVEAVREKCGYKKGAVADEETSVRGEQFTAILGQSNNATTVTDTAGLAEWIEKNFSKEELLELVKFGIGDLKTYLPGKTFDKFTKTERTGTRKLVIKKHSGA